MTWFSHSLTKEDKIKRIFDYLLSSSPETILFLCSSVQLIKLTKLFFILQGNLNLKRSNF